ncbi:MAG: PQQ-binding-like beta-propeller repeat protein [Halioglobus sp.]|nr:PQQ-binding-like beta-propeller repeat protein [Halioglobus sp.]
MNPAVAVSGWGVDAQNHRYIPESAAGITREKVGRLTLKWAYGLPDTEAPRFMPLISADTVIVSDADGLVYALGREDGCEKWRFDAGSQVRTGFRYLRDGARHLVYFGTFGADLIALDLLTGREAWRSNLADHPRAMLSGSGIDHDGVIYQPVSSWEVAWALNPFYACCTFRASVVAVRAATGEQLWRGYIIEEEPQVVESRLLLPDHLGPSGAPAWSQPTLDPARGLLYVGTGENYSQPATDTSDAILAFDMASGEMAWKQQFLPGDIWNMACEAPLHHNCPDGSGEDLDFGAPPILARVGERDYILAGQKSGRVFALDPASKGEPLWSYRAGAGGKAGGVHFAMAVDSGRGVLYVPVSDRPIANLEDSSDGAPNPSLHALDIATGKPLWETAAPGDCRDPASDNGERLEGCFEGFSAAITVTDNLVFAPTLDGFLRAFDADTGEQLWALDTRGDYPSASDTPAYGGAIDYGGVFLDGGELFVSSGYGQFGQIPGNAFMVFSVATDTNEQAP